MIRCSSSKRRMMWRLYVASSASMRIRPGRTSLIAAEPRLLVDVAELARERLLQPRVEPAPERARAADEVLPEPRLRLVQPERRAARERRALERRIGAVLVEPVAALVHRREEAVERVSGSRVVMRMSWVARDCANGWGAGSSRHAVSSKPKRRRMSSESCRCVAAGSFLDRRRRRRSRGFHERDEHLLEAVEDRAHLRRLHAGLVVVEQRVVQLVGRREAVDVAMLSSTCFSSDGTEVS